jgi:hypothetical protein
MTTMTSDNNVKNNEFEMVPRNGEYKDNDSNDDLVDNDDSDDNDSEEND